MVGEKTPPDPRDSSSDAGKPRPHAATDVRTPRANDRRHRAPETSGIAEGIRTLYG